jgi:Domain of unknown function (DUF4388)/DnaJ domain
VSAGAGKPTEPPEISGRLSETPLFVVVRRIQRAQLSGTLSVIRGDQVRQLVFENGELYAARSSREEHRIGATLVRWGYISEKDLQDALKDQKETHERIDSILVERGLVTRVVVDSEARRQMEQIVFSTLSWPDGTFHFEADTGPVELDVAISLSQEMIIEGIRRIPESEQFLELLGDLSGVPTLTRDPMSSGSLRLLRDAVGLVSHIDGKTSLQELLDSSAVPGSASAKILYSLLFAGLIEVHAAGVELPSEVVERRSGGRRAADRISGGYLYDIRAAGAFRKAAETGILTKPEAAPGAPVPAARIPTASIPSGPPSRVTQSPRELVLEMYRQLDWLSHYDLLGVSRKATEGEIEEAFRARSRLFDPTLKAHPELVDCWRQLTVLAKWLRVAYGVLSKPESRQTYDRKISEATPAAPPDLGKKKE